MIELTRKEQEAVILIYKDCTQYYSATKISKQLDLTQVGALKLLRRLEKSKMLIKRNIGKAVIYKINEGYELTKKALEFALVNQASDYERWKEEFKSLNKDSRIIIFYGSASRNYAQANDIDVLVILQKEEVRELNKALEKIQLSLPKKLHSIKATKQDLIKNIAEKNTAMLEIIKTGIVLSGYSAYMEVLNEFSGF